MLYEGRYNRAPSFVSCQSDLANMERVYPVGFALLRRPLVRAFAEELGIKDDEAAVALFRVYKMIHMPITFGQGRTTDGGSQDDESAIVHLYEAARNAVLMSQETQLRIQMVRQTVRVVNRPAEYSEPIREPLREREISGRVPFVQPRYHYF